MPDDQRAAPLLGILDEAAALVRDARAMPMSASVLVNRAELLDLVAAARDAVPDQVEAADRIVADAEAVLTRARDEADEALEHARAEAERLVADHEITARAHERAAEIVAAAEAKAKELREGADDYCDRRLAQFEVDLDGVRQQVQAGRARLAARGRPTSPE